VQPDVFVIPLAEARTMDWHQMRTLLLVAEILSPSSARADRFTKRRRYQEAGVPLYWVVDGDAHVVEVWTPTTEFPHTERKRLMWDPPGSAKPLTIELSDLFWPI
jgi:Uma2 family endonuclease